MGNALLNAMASYYKQSSDDGQLTPDSLLQKSILAVFVATATLLAMVIVLFGAPSSRHKDGRKQPPSMPGYWLPFLGHGPQFLLNKPSFLTKLRGQYPEGIFTLMMLGKKHHILHDPALSSTLMNRPHASLGEKWLSIRMLTKVFGLRKQDQITYGNISHEAPEIYKHLLSGPGLSNLVDAMVDQVRALASDFVTFNTSPADQMDWERSADAEVVANSKGESFVEADLTALIRDFVARTSNPGLFGTDFVENFPDFWHHLWVFDQGVVPLGAGVPSWLPWPRVQRATVARQRMLARTLEFEAALDKYLDGQEPGIKWQDMSNVSTFVQTRIRLYKQNGLSLEARASCDVALAWAMNANSNHVTSWLIFELYRDAVLLEMVREEIAPFVKVVQPGNEFGSAVWVAPELETLDMEGLIDDCPHLKAAYLETLRVYTGIWTIRLLSEDVVLERKGKQAGSYLLQRGHMAHMAHELHQFDPDYFPNPHEWHHRRFLDKVDGENGEKMQAKMGTLRPFGGGQSMCKGRAFAQRQILFHTAMIISLYDMMPPEGQAWEEPQTQKRAATRHPTKPIKVWIKRRNITSGPAQKTC